MLCCLLAPAFWITAQTAPPGLQTPMLRPKLSDSLVTGGPRMDDLRRPLLPPARNTYYQELGAACKVEYKLEKASRIPFRIRLGSLQQTDYLEQKPNALKP